MGPDSHGKAAMNEQFARVGAALASGRRLELLDVLAQGSRDVRALAEMCGMSNALASAHLKVLRSAGLVRASRQGQHVVHELASPAVYQLLSHVRATAHSHLAEAGRAVSAYLHLPGEHEPVRRDELLQRLRRGDVLVVDVRPNEEFAAGHIAGAISIPAEQLELRLDDLPVDTEIVAYCRGPYCVLASEAVAVLARSGRTARRLEEGFPEWRLAGFPVESSIAPA